MKDINKLILIGRLGADPVRKITKDGKTLVKFPVATNRPTAEVVDGKRVEETSWHPVVVWGKMAETCDQYLKCGEQAYIEGSVRLGRYIDKEKVSRLSYEVHADTIRFLGGNKKKDEPYSEAS